MNASIDEDSQDPHPDPPHRPMLGTTSRGYDAFGGEIATWMSDSTSWWPEPATAAGLPNVVVILVDDLGFSDLGAFGSEIPTPNIDRLAQAGLRFSNYHSTPLCSPSRAALLTGLNPHRAGFGYVAHADPGFPAFRLEVAEDVPTMAHSLRESGYATFAVGKWHLTKESNLHDGAPKYSWPLQKGFDRYYGSMDGFTTMYHPHRIVVDNSPEDRRWADDEYVTDTLTDRALGMIRTMRNNDADRPFFLYFAHQAVHGPIQATPDDLAVVRGRYDDGWDVVRDRRFARQQQLGVLPDHATLSPTPRTGPAAVPAWDDLDEREQRIAVRHMETFAASVVGIDRSVGRLIDELVRLGEFENTIFVVTSDNGATAEAGTLGTRSYFSHFGVGIDDDAWEHDVDRDLDDIGTVRVHGHYPAGWAHVSNTPFREYKFTAFEGGVHCPLIVSWPGGADRFDAVGTSRHQFAYVTDLLPTLLGLATVDRRPASPGLALPDIDGVDLGPVLSDEKAASPRVRQYVECGGAMAYFDGDWKAVARRRTGRFDLASGWELYDLSTDPAETTDLAQAHPERLADMIENWTRDAWRNLVFPLDDDDSVARVRPTSERDLARPLLVRPDAPVLERFRSSRLVYGRSFEVACRIEVTEDASGVIAAHGDQGGGYLIGLDRGRLALSYNAYGAMSRTRSSELAPGEREVVVRFTASDRLRWTIEADVDGRRVAQLGPVPQLLGMAPFTGISVGRDAQGPVDWQLHESFGEHRFDGIVDGVEWRPGALIDQDSVEFREIARRSARLDD